MRRYLGTSCLVLVLLLVSLSAVAETEESRKTNPNELRIGWGDQMMERVAFHAQNNGIAYSDGQIVSRQTYDYHYYQHWFVEYHYRHNKWFSYGGQVDASGFAWKEQTRVGTVPKSTEKSCNAWNVVVMPTIRFTYLYNEYVSLFSGIGVGMDISGGTEVDYRRRTTAVGMAMQFTPIGIKATYNRWFATAELGALIAFENGQVVYLPGARLISASIGVTF